MKKQITKNFCFNNAKQIFITIVITHKRRRPEVNISMNLTITSVLKFYEKWLNQV